MNLNCTKFHFLIQGLSAFSNYEAFNNLPKYPCSSSNIRTLFSRKLSEPVLGLLERILGGYWCVCVVCVVVCVLLLLVCVCVVLCVFCQCLCCVCVLLLLFVCCVMLYYITVIQYNICILQLLLFLLLLLHTVLCFL